MESGGIAIDPALHRVGFRTLKYLQRLVELQCPCLFVLMKLLKGLVESAKIALIGGENSKNMQRTVLWLGTQP